MRMGCSGQQIYLHLFQHKIFSEIYDMILSISSTILISIKSSSSFSSITLAITISSLNVGFLNSSFFSLCFFFFFFSFSFCFCHSGFVCLVLQFFPHSFGHLVICTSPVLQSISGLWCASP